MAKFTPEPLTATELPKKMQSKAEAFVWYGDGDLAAEVYGNLGALPEPIEALEMARLFAAAPDMYEALKSLLDSFNSYARIVSSMRRETTTSPAVQMAVAALAKADGHE